MLPALTLRATGAVALGVAFAAILASALDLFGAASPVAPKDAGTAYVLHFPENEAMLEQMARGMTHDLVPPADFSESLDAIMPAAGGEETVPDTEQESEPLSIPR